jgi:hypothetical protein
VLTDDQHLALLLQERLARTRDERVAVGPRSSAVEDSGEVVEAVGSSRHDPESLGELRRQHERSEG